MPKNRIKPEYSLLMSNGIKVFINQIGDMNGKKCFLITDSAGKFESFVITADGKPLEDEILTKKQQLMIPEIRHKILLILADQ